MLPEFRDAAGWRELGYRRLLEDMRIQVFEDGASYELSPGYQLAIASWFLEAYDNARRFGHPVEPELEEGIRSMYAWSAAISRPDFSRPSVSDAGALDTKYGRRLADPGRLIGDSACVWVGTEGAEGAQPDYGSIAERDSGYFVMRSGWDPDARFLLFEGGPFGRFHQHEDMLSIDVYAFGTPFIVDPGITSYFPNAWTEYYRTTEAHNTVLVDGRGQARKSGQTVEQWVESARDKTVWRSDHRSDMALAAYDAPYAGLGCAVVHRRAVMFIKPDYFLVLDELLGEGSHRYEALFHFMPFRVQIDVESGAVRTGRMDEANIEILPLTEMNTSLVCGRNDPVQGWVSIERQDVPAPVAIFEKTASLPIRAGYVIAPFASGRVTAGLSTRCTSQGESWSITIASPDREDRVEMDWTTETGPVLA